MFDLNLYLTLKTKWKPLNTSDLEMLENEKSYIKPCDIELKMKLA